MRIGIVTYHFSENYGALFQAYALRQWFIEQGHDAEFINYHPGYVEEGGSFNFRKPFTKDNLKILFLKIIGLKEKVFGHKSLKDGFEIFRKKSLGVSGLKLTESSSFIKVLPKYDLLVCGSDQIWKPSEHYGVDPIYYLDFSCGGVMPRRISYAPSFGTNSLGDKYQSAVGAAIANLDGISVRESTGCDIVEGLTGVRPYCVPDPTLLLTDYQQIMKPYSTVNKRHVFCYALRSRDVIGDVAEVIASSLNVKVLSPHNPHRRWMEIGKTVYPCPAQWLYLLNKSEYVVTNSFHGTALSILLKKDFVVVGLQGSKSEFNARVINLLKLVGLESRIINDSSPQTIQKLLNNKIDWESVDLKVCGLRDEGASYLMSELAKVVVNKNE